MHGVGIDLDLGYLPVQVAHDAGELGMEVTPFADTQEVQELAFAHAAELVARQFLSLLVEVLPEHEMAEELRLVGDEPPVRGVCGLARVDGTLTYIGNRQRRGDHKNMVEAAEGAGLHQHPGQAGVDGQSRHRAAHVGELRSTRSRPPIVGVLRCLDGRFADRPQLEQRAQAITDRPRIGGLYEGELGDVAET